MPDKKPSKTEEVAKKKKKDTTPDDPWLGKGQAKKAADAIKKAKDRTKNYPGL